MPDDTTNVAVNPEASTAPMGESPVVAGIDSESSLGDFMQSALEQGVASFDPPTEPSANVAPEKVEKIIPTREPVVAEKVTPEAEKAAAKPTKDDGVGELSDAAYKKMTPSAQKAFAATRREAKEASARVKELEAKLAALESQPVNTIEAEKAKLELETRIKALEKQNTEYEDRVRTLNVMESREFRTTVTEPLNHIQGVLQAYANKYEVPVEKLQAALLERDELKQSDLITELASGFNEKDRMRLYNIGEEVTKVLLTRQKLLEDAKLTSEVLEERRAKQQAEIRQRLSTEYQKSAEERWKFLEDKLPFLKSEDEELKAQVAEIKTKLKSVDFDKLTPKDRAALASQALVVPVLAKMLAQQGRELSEFKKKAEAVRNATPSVDGGSGSSSRGEPVDDDLTIGEAIARAMGR